MIRYIKCPRCDLNYIDGDKQEYCDVCIAEMKGDKLEFVDIDEDELLAEMEEEATELCPVCGVNLIRPGEKMCEDCKSKSAYEEEPEVDLEQDEAWKDYLTDDTTELSLDEEQLDEALKDELDEEDDEYDDEYESSDDEFVDDYDELSDDELDEDDDEDDDDDDLF